MNHMTIKNWTLLYIALLLTHPCAEHILALPVQYSTEHFCLQFSLTVGSSSWVVDVQFIGDSSGSVELVSGTAVELIVLLFDTGGTAERRNGNKKEV